ncbi:unnamed protein product [Rhizophagus irregularis]|uniref:Uncharacterized protein n=1 Tax=Rhizophagus irregularis TaxID=588596 RepID=A0A2I1GS56_9GLOM|nr:hypothetical protein RhiirA4_465498 [Rhizophagus irregularis]CAB4438948.1 unnamed protein product [Rhizophagus irregularis]
MRHLENEEEKEDIQKDQLQAHKIWCQEEERLKALEEEERAQTTKAGEEEEESESKEISADSEKEEQTFIKKIIKA